MCLNSLIKIQLLTIVQACGKHLCGLVVSTDKKFSERLARSSYSGGWVFFILFPGKTCSSYSGGEGLFPFPFPIHLVSIFLQRYCCE